MLNRGTSPSTASDKHLMKATGGSMANGTSARRQDRWESRTRPVISKTAMCQYVSAQERRGIGRYRQCGCSEVESGNRELLKGRRRD